MNIVFGKIVGDFNSYSLPDTTLNEETFKSSVNKSRLDLRIELSDLPRSPFCSLYIVYLFIGKFVLTYIAMVGVTNAGRES